MRFISLKKQGVTVTSPVCFLYSLEEKLGKTYCILKDVGLAAICIHKEKATFSK